jgi:ABC-type antimicrobial peptide transport system permease subunit
MAYGIISLVAIFFDSMLMLNYVAAYSELHYIFNSIRTIILIASITLVIYQVYMIMSSGMKDYSILCGLGATSSDIRVLNIAQMVLLIIVSIPIGLLLGYSLTASLLSHFDNLIQNKLVLEYITSISTLSIIAGVICSLIISIGCYLDRSLRKMPIWANLSCSSTFKEES